MTAAIEMQVARVGYTALKGGRHRTHSSVELAPGGPVGDRAFCLVDPGTSRCLRTVEHPTLLQSSASWDGRVLAVELPLGDAVAAPVPTGEVLSVDYWGRTASVQVLEGPWAAAFSAHLGREVVLVSAAPGEVVYGAPVSLVTNASLARLAHEVAEPVDGARFRATFQVDGDVSPHAEDEWVGRRLRLGTAEIEIRGAIPRCTVIDLDPATGSPDLRLLKALAGYRRRGQEIHFGVDAVVTLPGHVSTGDPIRLATA